MKRDIAICAALSGGLLLAFLQTDSNTNASSRFATIDALLRHRTFAIDATLTHWRTLDIAKVGDHFYSPKPPVFPALLAGIAGLFQEITGITFRNGRAVSIGFIGIVACVLPHMILLFYFHRLLLLWTTDPRAATWTFACVSLGYLGWGYATGLNNHTPTAAALVAAFYYAYRLRHGLSDLRRHWVTVGILCSVVATFDHPSAAFSLALFAYVLSADRRKALTLLLPAALPLLILNGIMNHAMTETVLPVQLYPGVFRFPGSYWMHPVGNDALFEPKPLYAFHLLLGHHGFFTMTPVLALAAWALAENFKSRERLAEALFVALPFAAMVLFYVTRTKNYGGNCVGFRWMIPAMPLLLLFAADWLAARPARKWTLLFVLLFAVGAFNAIDAVREPWQAVSQWNRLFVSGR